MKIEKLEEDVHVFNTGRHDNVKTFIEEIIEDGQQKDAFYICDMGDFVKKHKIWTTALPTVEPHYAVKCNDNLIVVETLAALGLGFDCASKQEIEKVLSLGVRPEKIIYANPVKDVTHILYAAAKGVTTMTFDNASELHKIKKCYPQARLVIRIRCDATDAQCPLGVKFGCDPATEAPELLKIAKSLNLDVVGVSFHVGSGCRELTAYARAIGEARKVFDFAKTNGYDFDLLDIGGGFPGDYGPNFGKIAEQVNVALKKYFPSSPVPEVPVRVIAEPGRFYVHTAFTLACNIHSSKDVMAINPETKQVEIHRMYYINDGVYGSFNSKVFCNEIYTPQALRNYPGTKMMGCSIWGPTCDGIDKVVENFLLPEMQVGDWIIFEEMGAYTISIATLFNGFPVPKVFTVADEAIKVLLKDTAPITKKHFDNDDPIDDEHQEFWLKRLIFSFKRPLLAGIHLINVL